MSVSFVPLSLSTDARPNETILDAARRAGAPLGNSCGATGICARCRVRIVSGAESLSPPTTIELRTSAQRGLEAEERLGCQAVVGGGGHVVVTTGYW
ncbi:MAG: (2Fe-2S)-binding protein [Acidobacteria bacterium]|nr:(2Fe-2S)-binding protein [Acidobacteriota bacterium]